MKCLFRFMGSTVNGPGSLIKGKRSSFGCCYSRTLGGFLEPLSLSAFPLESLNRMLQLVREDGWAKLFSGWNVSQSMLKWAFFNNYLKTWAFLSLEADLGGWQRCNGSIRGAVDSHMQVRRLITLPGMPGSWRHELVAINKHYVKWYGMEDLCVRGGILLWQPML